MDLIECGVQKPQELLRAERNHYYINYFHFFSLVSCINKAGCVVVSVFYRQFVNHWADRTGPDFPACILKIFSCIDMLGDTEAL